MSTENRLLIYGATGAVGRRLAQIAVQHGVQCVLSGRRRTELDAIAEPLGCEVRTATLENIGSSLDGIGVVASCVGPYTHFGLPVLQAAMANGAHYLDLAGEPRYVATLLNDYDGPARHAQVTIVPSAGLGLCSGLAARAACGQLAGPVDKITVGYVPWAMKPSRGTIQSTVEIMTGGAAVVDRGGCRFTAPGRVRRTALGLGARFPLTDPLTLSTMWPSASIDGYLLSNAAPLVGALLKGVGALGRSSTAMRAVRRIEHRLGGPEHPGGRFVVTIAAHDAHANSFASVEIGDTYELTSQAAFEVASSLLRGNCLPGVHASAAVVSDPAEVAARIGVRLRLNAGARQWER